jgi:hypothetical protein
MKAGYSPGLAKAKSSSSGMDGHPRPGKRILYF